jgi:hypothetical protein
MKTNNGGWGTSRIVGVATCHPDRKHYAKAMCRECYRNSPFMQERRQAYYQRNIPRFRKYTALARERRRQEARVYGITPEEQLRMLAAQHGLCALCSDPPKRRRLAIDHCHRTGHVRAFLCQRCNNALGLLRDDPNLCERAAAYLRHHSLQAESLPARSS